MKIKIIWDFRGEFSLKTAEHHAKHVKEFAENEKIPYFEIDKEYISDFHATAYIIVDKEKIYLIRDSLKPHRAEIIEN